MPVVLTGEGCDAWLEADVKTALKLQRPLPAERLAIVATGERRCRSAPVPVFSRLHAPLVRHRCRPARPSHPARLRHGQAPPEAAT
jgi:hypothetical protein